MVSVKNIIEVIKQRINEKLPHKKAREKSPDLIYAIGDIHGRQDLLRALIGKIKQDISEHDHNSIQRTLIIFLGDYIDRGPGSKDVIETISKLKIHGAELIFLRGNHEAAALDFLLDPNKGANWLQFGGRETLASYGVSLPKEVSDVEDWTKYGKAFLKKIPARHMAFLRSLISYKIEGEYMFVHAGINPSKPAEGQSDDEYLWIRDSFLKSMKKLPYIVVHGHTPEVRPVWDGRRIGIDTGAYMSNKLTAVRLLAGNVKFLST
ncbi:MAG: serine/threonine protein phosphatase [Hyphomonadaceae bacterium]|nr:serine/threonine protein phosphatase [Hyphomonadaceae bacterium]